jgi:outer membrane lipoprotein-sorting protein
VIRRASATGVALCLLVSAAGCGARRLALPTDAGTGLADFAPIHAAVSDACRGVRTLTTVLSLSGRAGDDRLGGDVHTGIRRPAEMRLEGVDPFGRTVFLLVSDGLGATLLLEDEAREARVVRHTRADEILGALIGVALAPADLQAVLTGCVVPDPRAVGGRVHQNGLISIDLEGGAQLYLQRSGGTWRVRAARRDNWEVQYVEWPEGARFPRRVLLLSETPVRVELRAALSDVQANVELPDAAFTLEVPPDATPLSLDILRESGPQREAAGSGPGEP